MLRIYNALIEVLAAAVFIIPIMIIFNKLFFHDIKKTFKYMIFGLYFAAILSIVGFPNLEELRIDLSINLIPLIDLKSDYLNATLNILLFIPFGFIMPLLWNKYRNIKSSILIGLFTSSFIEIVQIFTFRTTDINDLIMNTLGTAIGYTIALLLTKKFAKHIVSNLINRDFYIIFISVVLIMFLLQPYVSAFVWGIIL